MVYSIKEAISLIDSEEEVFILGGAKIYEQFLPYVNKMYLTIVHKEYNADTFFPEFNWLEWNVTEKEEIKDDIKAGVDYTFITLERKQSGFFVDL